MKNKVIIIVASLILSIVVFGFIAKPDETTIMYDYVQIMQQGKHIGISTIRGFEETKVSSESTLDESALLILLEDYQRNGYEVVNHSIAHSSPLLTSSILLRKKR
ncbi:MAG: hypothetical protein IPJ32_12140 [Sphingobacteriaceae bacterium]|nr:hypothetical protein [Sphingobacteriaceae bacterium]